MRISTMFKSLVVIFALGGFCSLGSYALGKYGIYETPEPCADCDPQALAKLRETVLAEFETPMTNAEKMVYLFDPEGNRL